MAERTALINARLARGLTRPDLATFMGASRRYILMIETGDRNPSFDFMRRWVSALGAGATLDLFSTDYAPPKRRGRKLGKPKTTEWAPQDDKAA